MVMHLSHLQAHGHLPPGHILRHHSRPVFELWAFL